MIKVLTKDEIVKCGLPIIKATMIEEVYWAAVTAFDDEDALSSRTMYGIYEEDKLVALGGLYDGWANPKKIWMSYIAVAPDSQRKGYGETLLKQIIETAKEEGRELLFVETYEGPDWTSARNFYEKNGFKRSGYLYNYLNDGTAAAYYTLSLNG